MKVVKFLLIVWAAGFVVCMVGGSLNAENGKRSTDAPLVARTVPAPAARSVVAKAVSLFSTARQRLPGDGCEVDGFAIAPCPNDR